MPQMGDETSIASRRVADKMMASSRTRPAHFAPPYPPASIEGHPRSKRDAELPGVKAGDMTKLRVTFHSRPRMVKTKKIGTM